MKTYQDLIQLIPKEKLRALHRPSAYRGVAQVFVEWVFIVSAALICEHYFSILLYLIVCAFIGARLLGLGILMHDAVHGLLHPNKSLNDFIGDVFCSWPLLLSLPTYRSKHLAHHRWLNTEKDPDFIGKTDDNWTFPLSRKKFIQIMLFQLSGLGVLETLKVMYNSPVVEKKKSTPPWYRVSRIVFYLTVLGLFIGFGLWQEMLLYWIIPLFTWTQFANRLRRLAEHSAIEGKLPDFQTRTTLHGIFARIFLAPNNIAYHNEHHLLPGVPFHQLPEVHSEIQKHPQARELLHTSDSYTEVLKEMVSKSWV